MRASSFAAFADVKLRFSPGVNIIVGDNGAGKSQLLKLLYTTTSVLAASQVTQPPSRGSMGREIARKLVGVFRPESLGRLTNRVRGRARATVTVKWKGIADPLEFSFATNSRSDVAVKRLPARFLDDTAVYLPTRELMSIYPGFVSTYNERVLEFDETWRDTADLLGRAPLRGPRSERARSLLTPIAEVLGGAVQEKSGRFYLYQEGVGNLEMHLVAEGLRKLAMIVRLVQSGTLLEGGYLFWDEPEANLNPRTLASVAQVIHLLAEAGAQVFVGTHSTFLLRELDLIQRSDAAMSMRVIGLARGSDGVTAQEADALDDLDLDFLASLQAEFDQTDRAVQVP